MAEKMDLFSGQEERDKDRPLADRMRPRDFDEFVGQEELVGQNSVLRRLIQEDKLCSIIFWGPPGSGKTTLAMLIAKKTQANFVSLSAVTSGIKEIKAIIEKAKFQLAAKGKKTVLFIDEIHRFNKAQQDAFLPHVEKATIILIGATAENPSFSIVSPLLSRCRVFVLERLSDENLKAILSNAINDKERGLGKYDLELEDGVIELIIRLSDGDARRALNLLELGVNSLEPVGKKAIKLTGEIIKQISQRQQLVYDKTGEEHYNLISALHKSLRGSDPNAALYWIGRMLASGEDPLYIARRMIRFASEDIGNADPQALVVAMAAKEAYQALGSPEGELALAQAAIYLATAPKSNSIYSAFSKVKEEIEQSGALPVPFVIRNAPTPLMESLGYGRDYKYDHNFPDHFAPQNYLPPEIQGKKFYQPGKFGFEQEIKKRMEWWAKKRKELEDQDK